MSLSLPSPLLLRRRRWRLTVAMLGGIVIGLGSGAFWLQHARALTAGHLAVHALLLWATAFVVASLVATLAYVRQRRVVRMLMAVRRVGARDGGRDEKIAAICSAVREGLGARGVRLDLSASHEGIWVDGQFAGTDPPARHGQPRAVIDDIVPLRRAERVIGALELRWPSRATRRLLTPVGHRDERGEVLALVGDAVAAELEIAGLAELLALETLDHGRSRVQDPLTRLLNRSAFIDEMTGRLTPVHGGIPAGAFVAVLDVNRFTEINATLGHDLGDAVLREVADRVVSELPEGSIVARIGGDEIGMLVPLRLPADHPSRSRTRHPGRPLGPVPPAAGSFLAPAVAAVMVPLLDRFRRLVVVGDVTVLVDAAIGAALVPEHGDEPAVLLRRAESAMRVAKDRRTTAYQIWDPTQEEQGARNLELAGDLRTAIDNGHLEVHYQPKTDLGTDNVVGVEALVRWRHPSLGWIAPDELIPLAERTGLIGGLTRVVLRAALEAGAGWNRRGLPLGVAVNVSARGLLDHTLVDDVCDAIRATGFDPRLVTLEITETELTPDAPVALEVLARLRSLGVRIAIDDFGTGYSALGYLSRLQVDELKIDKSFVTDLVDDDAKRAIVEAVVGVASSLGLATVAEGVEDEHVLDRLTAIGCTSAQGYLLSKPLPAASMAMWLWERRRRITPPPDGVIDLTARLGGDLGDPRDGGSVMAHRASAAVVTRSSADGQVVPVGRVGNTEAAPSDLG